MSPHYAKGPIGAQSPQLRTTGLKQADDEPVTE